MRPLVEIVLRVSVRVRLLTEEKLFFLIFTDDGWRDWLKGFLDLNAIRILNVAGSRASRAPGIEVFVQDVLDEARMHFTMSQRARDESTQGGERAVG